MSFRQLLTFICDNCTEQFTATEGMEIPPYWLAVHVTIANGDGFVADMQEGKWFHFCGQDCLAEFAGGEYMKELILLADMNNVPPQMPPDDMPPEFGGM